MGLFKFSYILVILIDKIRHQTAPMRLLCQNIFLILKCLRSLMRRKKF